MKRRARRVALTVSEVNPMALLALVCAFVLTLTDDITPEAFLLLVTGLAIPAKSGGYSTAEQAPIAAVPTSQPLPEGEGG